MLRLSNRLVLISIIAALSLSTTWITHAGPSDPPCGSRVKGNVTNTRDCKGSLSGLDYSDTDGSNTITNNSSVTADLNGGGAVATVGGNASADVTITNNSKVGNNIFGTFNDSHGGKSRVKANIVNNETIDGDLIGGISHVTGNGHADTDVTITNNGTVNANIFGIGTYSTGTGTAKVSTTIINNGTVKGDIVGSSAMGSGINVSNTIVLKDNAIVEGTIDGGVGASNTIVFNMTVVNPAEQNRLKLFFDNAPSLGEVTINGKTFRYTNIQQLVGCGIGRNHPACSK
jgi:hypothetical protein